jgi:hypothetical protein
MVSFIFTGSETNCICEYLKWPWYINAFECKLIGVPQGSILGPVLNIIYVNDLPINFEKCKVVGYADDTGMLLRSMILGDLCILAKNVITICMEWFSQQKLIMNPDKTALIFY